MVSIKEKTLTVSPEFSGERLDIFVFKLLNDPSRTLIQRLINEEQILVNGKAAKSGYKIKTNDKVFVSLPSPKQIEIKSEDIKLNVIFEDKDLIVVNKPQGMVTHPASGIYNGTLVNALLFHCKKSLSGINGILRPGIVHRLDKETSGLIIACKNDKSHREIAEQIKERKVKRFYYAIVHGCMPYEKGIINKPIGRDRISRHKMAVVKNGRNAITHCKVLKKLEKYTLLECQLETGRTHQIRVHMTSIGHPVFGDKTYGKKNDCKFEMMLHAYKLVFTHPKTKKEIKLETKMPERFKRFVEENT